MYVSEEQIAMVIDPTAFEVDSGGCYVIGDLGRRRKARFKAAEIRRMFDTPVTDEIIQVANQVGKVVHDAAREYVIRERAGASASMNGALEYLEIKIVQVVAQELDRVQAAGGSGFSLTPQVDQPSQQER